MLGRMWGKRAVGHELLFGYKKLSETATPTPDDLAGDGQLQVLADARPEHVGGGPHVGGKSDVEAGDGGFELGRGVGLERELAVRIE